MKLEDAIITALAYEKKVRDLYHSGISRIEDESGRKIFETLSREEQMHLDYLERMLDRLREEGRIDAEELKTEIPAAEVIKKGVESLKSKAAIDAKDGDVSLLRKALKLEQETGDFYKKMVEELDAEGRLFFKRFVEIEEGHLAIVRAELDHLSGTGYWFDFREFTLG